MIDLKNKLAHILAKAKDKNIAPSISLFVGNLDGLDIELHQGCASSTVYDLASLTKILGTTQSLIRLANDGNLSLREKPFAAWPKTTLASLLAHTSGLTAHIKFYEQKDIGGDFLKNRAIILDKLFTFNPAGSASYLYSDLGFIALGALLEERYKKPLAQIFAETLSKLQIPNNLFHFPSKKTMFNGKNFTIASAGYCPVRNICLCGKVHDLNCFFLGGIAGHAGLFGKLSDVKAMGQFFLSAYKNPNNGHEEILRVWAQKGLGFAKPTNRGTNAALSSQAFGHFGFTGVSLWIDPQAFSKKGVVIALLTNRVANGPDFEGIFWLRKQICDAVLRQKI